MLDNEFEKLLSDSVKEFGGEYEYFDDTPHQFSAGFEKNMKHIIRTGKPRRPKIMKLAAGIAAAAAMIIIGFAGFGISRMASNNNIISDTRSASSSAVSQTSESSENETSPVYNERIKNDTATDRAAEDNEPAFDNAGSITQEDKKTPDKKETTYNENKELSPENTAEAPAAAPEAKNNVTIKSSDRTISITDEKADEITEVLIKMVSDRNLCIKQPVSDKDISEISSTGFYVSVSAPDGTPIEINMIDGWGNYYCDSIKLCINETSGYAVAETNGTYISFGIKDISGTYSWLEKLTN